MEAPSVSQLLNLGGFAWSDGSLLLSLHPDGSRLAAARGPTLCICPLLRPSRPKATPQPLSQWQSAEGSAEDKQQEQEGEAEPPSQQGEQAVHDRQRTHGSAGPRPDHNLPQPRPSQLAGWPHRSRPSPPPPRFACRAPSGPPSVSPDDITALAWLAFARPPAAAGPGAASPGHTSGGGQPPPPPQSASGREAWAASSRRRTDSSGAGGGIFASIQVMLEDYELARSPSGGATAATTPGSPGGHLQPHTQPQPQAGGGSRGWQVRHHPGYSAVVLLSGTRGGALQLHDAESGAVLLRQQLHPGPVVGITVRTWRMGLKPDDAVEDVTVGWADAVVRLAAWELRAAASSCYAAAAAATEAKARGGGGAATRFGLWGSSTPSGPDVKPLAFQKWEVPAAVRGRSCVVCCGQRPRSLYAMLQGVGSNSSSTWSAPSPTGKTIFLAGGDRPASLAALQVDEQGGGGGALSYITSVATSVMGLARTATSVAAAPLAVGAGLRSFLLNPLQLGGGTSAANSTSGGTGHGQARGGSGAAAGGGTAPPAPQQPLASFVSSSNGQRHPATGTWRQFRDDGRTVVSLAPAPHGSLVAAVDGLGRVMLVEVGAMLVSRLWKGYRDAQVAWLEVPLKRVLRLQTSAQQRRPASQRPPPPTAAAAAAGQPPTQPATDSPQRPATAKPPAGPNESDACSGCAAGGTNPARSQSATATAAGHEGRNDGVDGDDGTYVLLLVMYAPRRQSLELWLPLQGPRLAAVTVPTRGSLLQRGGGGAAGAELGTWRVADAASAASPPLTPAGCMMCFMGRAPALGGDGEPEAEDGDVAQACGGTTAAPGRRGVELAGGFELVDVAAVFGLM